MLLRFRFGRVCAVFLKCARRRKFSEAMPHHVFRHEHGIENFSIVNGKRQPDEIRRDRRAARPCLNRRLSVRLLGLDDFPHQVVVNERTFFN